MSAEYILQLDKYATWAEYEEKLAIQRQKWHNNPNYLERRRLRRAAIEKTRPKKRQEIVRPPKLPICCAACGKLIKYAYVYYRHFYCSDECRKEARRKWDRERYRLRMQDPEYAAKERARGAENWRRWKEKKKNEQRQHGA